MAPDVCPKCGHLFLTEREREVLAAVAEGLTNAAIGRRLFISPNTVKIHVAHLLAKLGAHTRTAAVARAYERGHLDPPEQQAP